MQRRFKLANIVLDAGYPLQSCPEMLYRADGVVDYAAEDRSLAFERGVSFLTYFNALSAMKWKQYTTARTFKLYLELAGDACTIQFAGIAFDDADALYKPDRFEHRETPSIEEDVDVTLLGQPLRFAGSEEYAYLELEVPVDNMVLVGFELQSEGDTAVRNAYWYTEVDEADIRPIRIALATTTFKNEECVVPNIELVREQILACDDPIASGFHMYVIDNGRTLDAGLAGQGVTVIGNPNVGGAGGFARGMMAALEAEGVACDQEFTHVLLMDDDVAIFPESLKRTFNLLSLANDAYRDAFINGAMLKLEKPYIQFEDVAHIVSSGMFYRIKGNLFMDRLQDIAVNELIDVEVPRAYGAWWYSCIPLSAVRENGLPLPVFIRCDDVEFGVRNNPVYMTMNGICVWHAAFDDRFRASVDSYQNMRNYLIMMACTGQPDTTPFIMRSNRLLQLHLRLMAYETAELIVSALEDYLKGPEFLMQSNGEELFKKRGAQNERLLPLDEALALAIEEDPSLEKALAGFKPKRSMLKQDIPVPVHKVMRIIRTLPYDRHLLPDASLRNTPGTAYYGESSVVPSTSQVATRVLVACDREGEHAHVRVLDRARYKMIRTRWRKALRDFENRKDELERAYQEALPAMTSVEFWREYLDRAGSAR